MARLVLGLLVVGMFTLTGYYAMTTMSHVDAANACPCKHESGSCCSDHGGKCCQENGGKCCHDKESASEKSCSEGGKCCQETGGKCCHDKEAKEETKEVKEETASK